MFKYFDKIRPLIHGSKIIFTPLAISFFCYLAWQSRYHIDSLFRQTQHTWLITSIIIWISLHFISPLFTSTLLKSISLPLKYRDSFTIHNNRLPAKYIPGGIWHSVARSSDYYKHGITARQVATYLLIENIIIASVTLLLGGLIVANINNSYLYLFISSVIFSSAFVTINILLPTKINEKVKITDTPIVNTEYVKCIIIMFAYWGLASASFICYLQSFSNLDLSISTIEVAGIYLFSWGIGFITLFSPQGIGVSELVISYLIEVSLNSGAVIIIIAGFRIIVLIADMSTWISFISYKHLFKKLD